MKKFILLLVIISMVGCVSLNPEYAKANKQNRRGIFLL